MSPVLGDAVHPIAQPLLQLGQVEEEVVGRADPGTGAADLAPGVHELDGVHQLAAGVALVPPGVLELALGARALDEAVS